ncbi:MAG: fatty acid desaturase [Leptospiraceae bacterium]|nr:fatty acid desaturase [Leptospiraceae bacterium]MDW8307177.1 fatty acid desaturase [Leptospiraceae bacterium]
MNPIAILLVGHWFFAAFMQSFFLHRYAAHGYFRMSRFWEKFFYLITALAQGPSFLNARTYALLHRLHHAFSDTKRDPHSPVVYPNFFRMMMRTAAMYDGIARRTIKVKPKFTKNLVRWRLMENLSYSWVYRILAGSLYVFLYLWLVPPGEYHWYLFLPLHWFLGPIQGGIVNYLGHKVGYRNYQNTRDNSRNTVPVDLLIVGELYQNNHHARANLCNFARKKFEWDATYEIIRLLALLRIVRFSEAGARWK